MDQHIYTPIASSAIQGQSASSLTLSIVQGATSGFELWHLDLRKLFTQQDWIFGERENPYKSFAYY